MNGINIRIARPTNNIEAVVRFYRDELRLDVFGNYDHKGFDGVMLGRMGDFEFTRQRGHTVGREHSGVRSGFPTLA